MARKDKFGRTRKGATKGVTSRLEGLNLRSLWARGEYLAFFALTTFMFIGVVILLVTIAAGGGITAVFASIVLFVWIASIVDLDTVRSVAQSLWGSSAAERLKDLWDRVLPHRNRRGQASVRAVVLAGLLVLSLVGGSALAVSGVGATDTTTTQSCSTEILHDHFQSDTAISTFNDSGEVSSTKANTRVTVAETDAFYRVRADNPNGYCVAFTVRIAPEIIPATERGQVSSDSGNVSAEWHDVTNFDTDRTYTEITFVAPANSEVLFAPSKPTVVIPAWRDTQKREAQGILDRLENFNPFGNETLEKRHYQFSGTEANGSYVTVPLQNESTNQSIDEWQAVYRVSEDDPWRPIDTESDDPVFVREVDGKVQFVFNDKDAEVEFTANPDTSDTIRYETRSMRASFHDAISLNFLTLTAVVLALTATPLTARYGRDRR
ncbi:hypothetical protein [Halostella litorea]|uniref:hypothetical protein n=1 Tax=Halostella litorea TaxID=2528831 RepID=UPI00109335AB|nr:hypothetical protein [Halostella litorea]